MMVMQAQFLPVFRRNSRLKRALWYMASPNEATLRGKINHFNYTSAEKIWGTETANSENIFKTGHLSYMGDPLNFHVNNNNNNLLFVYR